MESYAKFYRSFFRTGCCDNRYGSRMRIVVYSKGNRENDIETLGSHFSPIFQPLTLQTAFCNWTDNFMALTPSGRLAAHLPSILSFILPTISALFEAIILSWIWYDYHRVGVPTISYSHSIGAFLITEARVTTLFGSVIFCR